MKAVVRARRSLLRRKPKRTGRSRLRSVTAAPSAPHAASASSTSEESASAISLLPGHEESREREGESLFYSIVESRE
eukprot:scaffold117586_cov33-Tisochrysis_lutea.AAC.4